MNKIVLSNDDELDNIVIDEDTELSIDLYNKKRILNVIVESNVCLSVLETSNCTDSELTISIKNGSRLIYNKIGRNIKDKVFINLDGEGSSVKFNSSVVADKDSLCQVEVRHNADNTVSQFYNHGINNSDDTMVFKIDAYIPVGSKMCKTSQENKVINTKCGKSSILPNLIIDVDDVEATHSAFIGDFNKEVVFYLKTRGLTFEEAKRLLINGFLLGNVTYEENNIPHVEELLEI